MFLVFAGQCYYPSAGAGSLVTKSESLYEAKAIASKLLGLTGISEENAWMWEEDPSLEDGDRIEWVHVLDLDSMEIVFRVGDSPYGDDGPYTRFSYSGEEVFIQ